MQSISSPAGAQLEMDASYAGPFAYRLNGQKRNGQRSKNLSVPQMVGFDGAFSVRDVGPSEIGIELVDVMAIGDDPAGVPWIHIGPEEDHRAPPSARFHDRFYIYPHCQ